MTAPEMFSLPELRMFKHALKLSADKEGYVTRQQCGSALTLRLSREPDSAENKGFIEWLRRHGVLIRDEEWEIAEDAAAAKAAEDAAAKAAEDAAAAVAKAARDAAAAALKAAEDAAAAKEAEDAAAAAKAAQDAAAAKEAQDAAAAKEAKEEEPPTGMVFMKDGLVPCHDYDVDSDGTPMAVNHPGTFRLCGHGVLDYGFQLTANEDMETVPQQGHFLCRVQFELDSTSSEIFLKFDYHMYGDGVSGGEGLCAYLLDPSIKGWDTSFDTSGPMGFTGKAGALIGVALDLSGNFSGGPEFANHVTVRESAAPIGQNIASVLYKPQQLSTTDEEWRSVLVKFDIDDLNIDVEIDGEEVMKDVPFPPGMKPPRSACVAVCGAASNDEYMISVNDVRLVSQRDE